MRRNQIIMGTGVSLDIPKCADEEVYEAVFDLLKDIDVRFSPYRSDNELSAYQRGEIKEQDLSSDMKEIKTACEEFEKLTNGYFTANFEGKFNPTGYVKGWAIAKAGKLIEKLGYKTFCIGIGGDILAQSDGKKTWNIAIQNPINKDEILNTLSISNGAVATSGEYERGQHIINPKTGQPATDLLSLTVIGSDIIKADVLATAAFAMGKPGKPGIEFINQQNGYEALAFDKKSKVHLSAGMNRLL